MSSAEIKCSSKQSTGTYVRAGKSMLFGSKSDAQMDDSKKKREDREPVDEVIFSGLGSAIATCTAAAVRLEKDGVARISKIETNLPDLKGDDGKMRKVPQIRICLTKNN